MLNERTVPRNTARSGMTLYASPAWIWVTLTTQVSTGRTLRETIDCKAVVMWLATTTGSIPDSGRAPCAFAGDRDIEKRATRHHRPRADLEFADRQPRPVVHPEHGLAREFVEQPVLDHRIGAALTLLRRLKDEMHGAVEIARFREIARRAEQHRRVPVMAAGVHAAVVLRPVRKGVGFENRQAIHIGPQPDRARRVADPQPSDEAGLADAAMHLDPKALELFGHKVGGALLLKAQFGVSVDVAPPFGQLVVKAADLVDDRHGCSFGTAERAASGSLHYQNAARMAATTV